MKRSVLRELKNTLEKWKRKEYWVFNLGKEMKKKKKQNNNCKMVNVTEDIEEEIIQER